MHYFLFYYWVLLPVFLVSAVSHVSRSLPTASSSHPLEDAIKALRIEQNSAQASFFVPCLNCIGGPSGLLNQSFLFNLEAFPSEQPCGYNNVSLNGIPLLQNWESTGIHGQASASLNSSGHALSVLVTSDCLHGVGQDEDDDVAKSQLLTLTIQKVDQEQVQSLAGFTLSFKQHPFPELLRLSLAPEYSARDLPDSETWRDPPSSVRLPASIPEDASPLDDSESLSLKEQLRELQELEDKANELVRLIQEKKDLINLRFPKATKGLKQEIESCESFLCVVKAIGRRVHNAAHAAYIRFHSSHQPYASWHASAGGQAPTMLASEAVAVAAPEQCHVHKGRPSERPPPYRGPLTAPREKSPAQNYTQPSTGEPKWRDATDPSIFIVVLKFLAVVTGLAFLFSLLRRCCMSDRKRAERAAERERRATERLYKCAARKQSWRDWWTGRKRGKPGYRQGDYEEKRALILQQEHILEGAMQDEIQQLRIREEIRQLRQTRDAVDDLVRAEEGRSVLPLYSASASSPHTFYPRPIPAPITIPPATSRMYPVHDSDEHPPTPLSRTSSLPGYKTEGSEPPGYESDRRSSFSSHDGDGFSEYAHSVRTTESQWSPDSSIPDLSPRPSMETALTVETARTFL
ncbi:uncharacterized protein PV09_00644 [Verruconis gallopava]|uniref:Uncharacterized protein n=1 Tax=Verruconis gallopava TaxID=253628 RepID=A0A0D1Z6V8_9PEZI|nr:uncharacterized protein PV09_00644 [Verruconis gallopava]KIW08697.1 hypothetical protein PV09_00644 [Verruconis gallopava]